MNKIRFLKDKIDLRIKLKNESIFLRKDFADLGDYDQVGRVLKALVRENKMLRLGYGLYARAEISPFNRKIIPEKSLPELATDALKRLGVPTAVSQVEKDYNTGKSTQVPTGRSIAVQGRINRKIGYGNTFITYERSST